MKDSLTVITANTRRNNKTESKPEECGASVFKPTQWISISSYQLSAREDRFKTPASPSSGPFNQTVFVARFRTASRRKERVDFHFRQLECFSVCCRSSEVVLGRPTSLLCITLFRYPGTGRRFRFPVTHQESLG